MNATNHRAMHTTALNLSLTELLIGLAIFSMLFAAMVPNFSGRSANQQMESATSELLAGIRQARHEAVVRGQTVSLCPLGSNQQGCAQDGTWENGWLMYVDDGSADSATRPEAILAQRKLGATAGKLTIRGRAPLAQRILFSSSGVTVRSVGTLVFCDARGFGDAARAVILHTNGRARVIKATESNHSSCLSA